jgi:hypothetical protein
MLDAPEQEGEDYTDEEVEALNRAGLRVCGVSLLATLWDRERETRMANEPTQRGWPRSPAPVRTSSRVWR